jgi:hypothetical protein
VVKRRTPLVNTPTRLVGAENEIDKWYGLTTKPAYFVIYQIAACWFDSNPYSNIYYYGMSLFNIKGST